MFLKGRKDVLLGVGLGHLDLAMYNDNIKEMVLITKHTPATVIVGGKEVLRCRGW